MKQSRNIPKSHLFTEDDLPIFDYNQLFSAGSMWLEKGMDTQVATFDLYVRDLPEARNFLLFGGLEEILIGLTKWRYRDHHITALFAPGIITSRFAKYLKHFKFSGDVWAMPEGTPFFGDEPVMRITAPIIEANLITIFLMNVLTSNTIFMSKAIRCVLAARPKACNGIYGARAHSFESSMKSARNSYLTGTQGIACAAFWRKYHMPVPPGLTIAYHAFIKSFPDELTAMRTAAELFGKKGIFLMVDTYDFKQGLRNAVRVTKESAGRGGALKGIVIDSGDVAELSRYARKELDKAGLPQVKITVAGNLDEYKIAKLVAKKIPIDAFLVVTEGVTSSDAPKLETVYKMAQIRIGKQVKMTAKFAPGKLSLPGVKQVYRVSKGDHYVRDVIGLEGEKLGQPLLRKYMSHGKITRLLPDLPHIKNYIQDEIKRLPSRLLKIEHQPLYSVTVSPRLLKQLAAVKKEHVE